MDQERIIDTGLTGPIQKDILASIMGQLSDGYWENSPRMEQYWRNANVQERDGKVVLVIRKHAFPYYAMSDDQIKQWFAKKIKFIIKEEFGKGRNVWSRTNTKQKTDWLSHKCPSQTSVSDCYQAYDILMGRNTANKKYSMESVYNKLIGKKVIKESVNTVEDAISDWTIDVDLVDEGKRGYTEEKLRKFAEFFLPICPKWCSHCESTDLNEYEEDSAPKYVPMINIDQIIFIMLLPNGTTVRVEDSYAPVTDFRNWEKAKKYIIEQLEDEGVDMTTESVNKPSKRKVIKEEVYTGYAFREAFEDWKPSNYKQVGNFGYDDNGNPSFGWLDGTVIVSLTEAGRILVHTPLMVDGNQQEDGCTRQFEIDEMDMAKECIEGLIDELGIADESKKPSRKAVIKQGAMKEIYTKFVEEFAYWVPRNQTSRGDLTEDMEGNPCVAFEDGRVVISLLEFGRKIKVCADQSQDYMRKYFNFDEVEAIKKYTESLIDYIHSDANNLQESKDTSKCGKVFKHLIKESEGYDSADELEPFENDYVPTEEQIRKEAMAQLRYEDIPYSEAKMLANDIVASLCGQPFDSKSEFEQYVSFEIKENLRAFWESKKIDKSKKVIKQGIEDWEISKAIQQAVYDFDWKGVEYDDVDVIGEFEYNLCGGNFKNEFQVQKIVTDYLNEHYRDFACQSVKPSKKKEVIKESSFDNVHWDMDVTYPTLDQVIATLKKARKELGNVEVAVQYRDDGGEYSGYDNKLYFWFDKETNTFVL